MGITESRMPQIVRSMTDGGGEDAPRGPREEPEGRRTFDEAFRNLYSVLDSIATILLEDDLRATVMRLHMSVSDGLPLKGGVTFRDKSEWQRAEALLRRMATLTPNEFRRAKEDLTDEEFEAAKQKSVWDAVEKLGRLKPGEITDSKFRTESAKSRQEASRGPVWRDEQRAREVAWLEGEHEKDKEAVTSDLLKKTGRLSASERLDKVFEVATEGEERILQAMRDDISEHASLSQTRVAESLGVTPQRVNGALRRLRKKVSSDPDLQK